MWRGPGRGVSACRRFLHGHGITVVEVDRPNRQTRRRVGKSDSTDAVAAARAALSGSASVVPKDANGPVEQMRILMVARRSARSQRIETLNQLRHLVFTGPEQVGVRFKDRPKTGLVTDVARMRPRKGPDPVLYTTQMTMRGLARRIQHLNHETKDLDVTLAELVNDTAPSLVGPLRDRNRHGSLATRSCGRQPRPAPQREIVGAPMWRQLRSRQVQAKPTGGTG